MICKKHPNQGIPCHRCMMDEYLYAQKDNDEHIKKGMNPKHDTSHLERELRKKGLIL